MEVPTKVSPKLLDNVCDTIASTLSSRLSWLNNSFGRCDKFVEYQDVGSDFIFPVIYTGGRDGLDYIKLLPDQDLGNFCFIDVDVEQSIPENNIGSVTIESKIAIIFWWDYRTVYPNDWQNRTIENVKHEVLTALSSGIPINGRVIPYMLKESAREMYSTFSTRAIDAYNSNEGMRQALIRPFGGFRLDCTVKFSQGCL